MNETVIGTLPTLAEVRRERGISQRRLAVMAWMKPSAIGAIEAGHTRVFNGWRVRLANVLGTTPDAIDWDAPLSKRLRSDT